MAVAITLDGVRDHCLYGWAIDPANTNKRVTVQLCHGDAVLAERRADQFRADLQAAGVGDGKRGFSLNLPDKLFPRGTSFQLRVLGKEVAVGGTDLARVSEEIIAAISAKLVESASAVVRLVNGHSVEVRLACPEGLSGTLELAFDGLVVSRRPLGRATASTAILIPVPVEFRSEGERNVSVTLVAGDQRFLLADEVIKTQAYVPSFKGRVDAVSDGSIRGWAWDENDPIAPVNVRIFIDGRFVARVTADQFREDLRTSNIRDGKAAFTFEVPHAYLDGALHAVRAIGGGTAAFELNPLEFRLSPPRQLEAEAFLEPSDCPAQMLVAESLEDNTTAGAMQALARIGRPVRDATMGRALRRVTRKREPVTVIVPVYNAKEHLERCLDALERNTSAPFKLILIDDASTEPGIDKVLRDARQRFDAKIIRNRENCGFTRSANAGLSSTASDVVLLNSDTEVGPRWLERLTYTAYSAPGIATVSAMSPNAGAFSIPRIYEPNRIIPGLSKDEHSTLIGRSTGGSRMSVPTGHGFCMFIRREALDELGLLDEKHFPRGYGEENDFCMRAVKAGYQNVIDDRVIVHHAVSASFGESREALMKDGQRQLAQLHPEYTRLTTVFRGPSALSDARGEALKVEQWASGDLNSDAARQMAKPRILFTLHYAGEGGTALTTEDLVGEAARDFDCYLLTPQSDELLLSRWSDKWVPLSTWKLSAPIDYLAAPRPDYEAAVTNILVDFDISVLHVRHLIGHHPVIMQAAAELGVPVIWSLHDFYQVCPTVSLVDAEGNFCGGKCTRGSGDCDSKVALPAQYGRLRSSSINSWQQASSALAKHASAIVTTSAAAKQITVEALPGLRERPYFLIEHGRERVEIPSAAETPTMHEPARVLMLGNILPEYKGFKVARAIHELDTDGEIEFHFLGAAPAEAADIGIVHGRYKREELTDKIAEIAPSFVAILSTWAETYCHTVTEAWQSGVPVLGSQLGAVGERISRHGGGWVVDCDKPGEILSLVKQLRRDPDAYESVKRSASSANLRDVRDMGSDYRLLYKSLARKRSVAPGGDIVRIIIPPAERVSWGSSQARWRALLEHSSVRRLADVVELRAGELKSYGLPRYGVPAADQFLIDFGRHFSSAPTAGAEGLVDPDELELHLQLINDLPWTSASLLPVETRSRPGNPPCIAIVLAGDASANPGFQSWLESLRSAQCDLRVIDVSTLGGSASAADFARDLRAALLGCAAIVLMPGTGWEISNELNLAELALMGLPLVLQSAEAELLGLGGGEAILVEDDQWSEALEAAVGGDALSRAAKAAELVADRFGVARHAARLISSIRSMATTSVTPEK